MIITSTITEDALRAIIELETLSFPEEIREDAESIKETTANESTVAVLAYNEEGRLAGYVFAVPHDQAYEHLREIDEEMENREDALYLSSIAIHPDFQGKGYFSALMKSFLERASGRTVTMHARTSNHCSAGMQKHGARHVRTVSDWFGTGEDFDFLIIEQKP